MAIQLQEVLKTDTLEIQRQKFNQVALDIFNTLGGAAQLSVLDVGISDGLVTDPSLYFNNEPGLGIFRSQQNALSFASDGQNPFSIKPDWGIFYNELVVGKEGIGSLDVVGTNSNFIPGQYIVSPTGGSGSGASIQFNVINYAFTLTGGSGYVPGSYTNVQLTGGAGSGATANITVRGLVGSITDGGSGYGDTQFSNVLLSGGNGSGARATLLSSDGEIVQVTITDNGSGYQSGNILSYSGGGGSGFQFTISQTPYAVSSVSLTANDSYAVTNQLTASNTDLGGTGSGFNIVLTQKGYIDESSITILNPGMDYVIGDIVAVQVGGPAFTTTMEVMTSGDNKNFLVTAANGNVTTVGQVTASSANFTNLISVSNRINVDGVTLYDNIISTTQSTDLFLTTSIESTRVVVKGRDFVVSDGSQDLFVVDSVTGNVSIGGSSGGGGGGSGGISFGTLRIVDNTLENTLVGYNSFGSILTTDIASSGSNYDPKIHTGVGLIGSQDGDGAVANITVSPWKANIQGGSNYVNGSYTNVNLYEQTGVTRSFSVANSGTTSYVIAGTDLNGSVSGNDPTITVNAGDLLEFTVNATGHPFYIQSVVAPLSSGNLVPSVRNNGSSNGIVRWEPPVAGTYYYVCGNHPTMTGTIVVNAVNATGVNADVTISGNTVTQIFINNYGTGYAQGDVLVAAYGELGGTLGALSPAPSGFNVTIGNLGVVTSVVITNGGTNYSNGESITAIISPNYITQLTGLIGGSGYDSGIYQNVPFVSGDGVLKEIDTISITTPGSGLTNGIYYGVALTGGSGNGAVADVTVSGGSVTNVVIIDPGTGYTNGNTLQITGLSGPILTITGIVQSAGQSAIANFTVSGAGVITNVELVSGGSGYSVGDILTVSPQFDTNNNGDGFEIEVQSVQSGVGYNGEVTSINGSGILIIPASDRLVKVKSTSGFVIPSGTGTERPLDAEVGCIRYNIETDQYEGYNGNDFVSLGGVRDVDGNTYITAELSAGNDDNTLTFYNDGFNTINITKNDFDFNTLDTLRKVNIIEDGEVAKTWKASSTFDPNPPLQSTTPETHYIYFEDRLYEVLNDGVTSSVAGPTHTSGAAFNGTIELDFIRYIYDNFSMQFADLTIETQNNNSLNIDSKTINYDNSSLIFKSESNGYSLYKNSGYYGIGLRSSGVDNLFVKFYPVSNSVAGLIVDTGYSSGTPNEITFIDSKLESLELSHIRQETNRVNLVKGSANLGSINVYDYTNYSSAKVYIIADNVTTGEKETVEYSIIDNGNDIYTTEYNQISTNPSVQLYTVDVAYNGNFVRMDFTIGISVATADNVVITAVKTLTKK